MDIAIPDVVDGREPPSLTYRLDFDRGRITGTVDEREAVEQFIRVELITPRFKCIALDDYAGSEIKETLLLDDATAEFIESDMPRMLDEALLKDSRIIGVDNIDVRLEDESAYIYLEVSTVFGPVATEVVV